MAGRTDAVRGLLAASHLAPTVLVTALAVLFAAGIGAAPARIALIGLAVLTGQLSVGWSNDWIDARRDVSAARADKPVAAGLVTAPTVRAAALSALCACVLLSWATGWLAGTLHLLAVASAWSYNLGLKATAWSWAPYAASFGLLPVFVVRAVHPEASTAAWAIAATALLGIGAHVANALPDLEDDQRAGIRGLPHRIGRNGAGIAAPAVLIAATAVVVAGPAGPPGAVHWAGAALATVLAVGAGAVARSRRRSRAPFSLSMAVAAVCVILLVLSADALVATAR